MRLRRATTIASWPGPLPWGTTVHTKSGHKGFVVGIPVELAGLKSDACWWYGRKDVVWVKLLYPGDYAAVPYTLDQLEVEE